MLVREGDETSIDALGIDGTHQRLGAPDLGADTRWHRHIDFARNSGGWFATAFDGKVYVVEVGDASLSEPRLLGTIDDSDPYVVTDPLGRFIATIEKDGKITLWDVEGDAPPRVLQGPSGRPGFWIAPDGSLLLAMARSPSLSRVSGRNGTALSRVELDAERGQSWFWTMDGGEPRLLGRFAGRLRKLDPVGRHAAGLGRDGKVTLRFLDAPAETKAIELRRGEIGDVWSLDFHPGGGWLASGDGAGLVLWPLVRPYPAVIRAHKDSVTGMVPIRRSDGSPRARRTAPSRSGRWSPTPRFRS
jgi:WD40 repeat protein